MRIDKILQEYVNVLDTCDYIRFCRAREELPDLAIEILAKILGSSVYVWETCRRLDPDYGGRNV